MLARWLTVPVLALAAAGCATISTPQPQASTAAQECKVVAVYSASDVMRNQNARGVPGSTMARADGANESARLAGFAPLQPRTAPRLDSNLSGLARQC